MNSVQWVKESLTQTQVHSITLDHVAQKYEIDKVNFLKIDVEGHELEVLKGANYVLNKCENIAIETHELENDPLCAQIQEVLREHGF